jgi:hypothetical protein
MWRRHRRSFATALVVLAAWPAAASAVDLDDPATQWLPRSDGATWTYQWSNSAFASVPRTETYSLSTRSGRWFRLNFSESGLRPDQDPAAGTMDFFTTDVGLVNLNYSSTPSPRNFPILCASAIACGNSIAGPLFLTIWGTRSPVLAEPLVKGTTWTSTGGASNDVAATNRYLGHERVVTPAFPAGVDAAKIESTVTQAGALGDPFGSGLRTVWWVYGVGPVRILFQHTGGETSFAQLSATTLAPRPLPSDANLLPLKTGDVARLRWRNDKHMKKWSEQRFEVSGVVNNTARVNVTDVSGPLDVVGSYAFTSRLAGTTAISSVFRRVVAAASVKLPRLGPKNGPEGRRRFVTPYDLMTFGYNPVLPAYAFKGQTWRSDANSRDFQVNGVTGVTTVLGQRIVRVPSGRYKAIAVRSTLRQNGHRFGSGSRTSYFAPDVGLVKLTFRHDDGSTSTVERTR